ncbi:hypothetical protein DSCOOX_54320 [Desulfosarcina ovata subsp. ovata]|uniref:Uncharacterized protein n=1 Tax=Desulfosarcina ovata subsp. ovata TaxID=2752305 RepID=A0A5K8AHT8_9BACT|nr:hypothetical protein DSCOOX_54320 [Desulfosarcina ovata subsp. ovata]
MWTRGQRGIDRCSRIKLLFEYTGGYNFSDGDLTCWYMGCYDRAQNDLINPNPDRQRKVK